MELISSLDTARSSENVLPNLAHLEAVYKDAVGDKKEIDLNDFKKIVQSKNMFFVERIFRIFDADNSGAISMEEFMRVMTSFSSQTPLEKLGYLFRVYDLDGDNNIQFSELRSVISECMKENGLTFSEFEIDELTSMLFHDADTDRSGSITFSEFRDQLQRHPAFMENLTLSMERWLLPCKDPPKTSQRLRRMKPSKLSWKHIRNNWSSVAFLVSFLLINLGLFASRSVEYIHHGPYVAIARACGQCLNFTCSFVLVLVLRQTLTWLRTHGLAQYLPIDQHLYYHKFTGYFILVYAILHTIMHIANFARLSSIKNIPLHIYLFSTNLGIGWVHGTACLTGWILLFILLSMLMSALPFVRRSGKFEVFYLVHQLSIVFWICLIIHGPNFWKWFLGPAVLFIIETTIRINRNLSSSKRAYVQQGILLPSNVTQLVIKRPRKFDYRPGDYVYINIPTIAKFEWHPFTISSAPELDDTIWLHIRGVGEWTNSLHKFFERHDKEAVLSEELAKNPKLDWMTHINIQSATPKKDQVSYASAQSTFPTSPRSQSVMSPSITSHVALDIMADRSSIDYIDRSRLSQVSNETPPPSNILEKKFSSKRKTTSFCSTSTSRVVQRKNNEDAKSIIAQHRHRSSSSLNNQLRLPQNRRAMRDNMLSVRVSVAEYGPRRCQTVIVMPTIGDEEEEESASTGLSPIEEVTKELEHGGEMENIIVNLRPLKIFLDGPYGSPTRHIFQASHAVLIATGIGVTPFASILQSIMYQYKKSRHACPNCNHRWTDPRPVSSVQLRKVDFFWLNRYQRSFEWFVSLLSELEVEQAQLLEKDRFLDIHMYITSALDRTDMKAVGLQMALDLLYQKEKRCLITGLKSRTQPGRPNWTQVFKEIAQQNKGKVTVFFCGSNQLAKTLLEKCNEFGFRFRKEIF